MGKRPPSALPVGHGPRKWSLVGGSFSPLKMVQQFGLRKSWKVFCNRSLCLFYEGGRHGLWTKAVLLDESAFWLIFFLRKKTPFGRVGDVFFLGRKRLDFKEMLPFEMLDVMSFSQDTSGSPQNFHLRNCALNISCGLRKPP